MRAETKRTGSFRMPPEHGAWAIVLVPFASAAAIAQTWNTPLLLASLCVLSVFLLRGSLQAQAPDARWRALLSPAHLSFAGVLCAAGALLVLSYQREELLWLALIAAALYLLQQLLADKDAKKNAEKRSLPAELVGVCLLTLSAPAAWIAARGSLIEGEPNAIWAASSGIQVWLLNVLFFLGGILSVKYRVRALLAHHDFRGARERLAFAWPVLVYHLLLAVLLAVWIAVDLLAASPHVSTLHGVVLGLAFSPSLIRAGHVLWMLGRRFPIRRAGWNEIAQAVVFATLLILAFRWNR